MQAILLINMGNIEQIKPCTVEISDLCCSLQSSLHGSVYFWSVIKQRYSNLKFIINIMLGYFLLPSLVIGYQEDSVDPIDAINPSPISSKHMNKEDTLSAITVLLFILEGEK